MSGATPDPAVTWADPAELGTPPIDHMLAVYGTLRPGESNHHEMSEIDGSWYRGTIRGRRFINPAGRYRGYPAFVPGQDDNAVPVAVLVSAALPAHWQRLDDFEGPGYRRVPIGVALAPTRSGQPEVITRAYVYETLPHPA